VQLGQLGGINQLLGECLPALLWPLGVGMGELLQDAQVAADGGAAEQQWKPLTCMHACMCAHGMQK
jgi:hypothetical protein